MSDGNRLSGWPDRLGPEMETAASSRVKMVPLE
jgi:hypothetical protein